MGLFSKKERAAYAVIGLGRFGQAVANTLHQYGETVIVIDKDPEKIREIRAITDYAYIMRKFDMQSFEDAGIEEVGTAVICIGENLDANLLAVLYCQNLKVPRIIAKANTNDQGAILKKMGVEVVHPERDSGNRLARELLNQEVVDYFSITANLDLAQIPVPSYFIGKRLIDLKLRQKWGINVIAIKTLNTTIEDIDPYYIFKKDDIIIVVGSLENIRRFEDQMPD